MDKERMAKLTQLLLQAQAAHHDWEQGALTDHHSDGQWAEWYAEFMLRNGLADIFNEESPMRGW